jgi:hypothetical protein
MKTFGQYLKEQAEMQSDDSTPLKGYTADQIIDRIENLMDIFSDSIRFGVPSDMLGKATTYRDANGAIEKIKDIKHYYDQNGDEVRFYGWSIAYKGSWEATQTLKEKIKTAVDFGEEKLNMNLKKVIEYFTENKEDSDKVRSISISVDSKQAREAKAKAKEEGEDQEQFNA